MAEFPNFQQQLSQVQVQNPVPPPQTNTGSLAGDLLGAASFGLSVLQREQQKAQQEQAAKAQAQMVTGISRIAQNKADRDSQGLSVQQNLIKTQREIAAFRATLPAHLQEEASKQVKTALGFQPSAKITETQVSQFDQERDFLNERGIDTRDLTQTEVTDQYLSAIRSERAAEVKNDKIEQQLQGLRLQKATRENKQAINQMQQQQLFNNVRAIGVQSVNQQKLLLEKAKQRGNPQEIKQAQDNLLATVSQAVAFTESSMISAAQQAGIDLDPALMNTQRSGVKAWGDSIISSENNTLLAKANKHRIELVNSEIALDLLSKSPEVSAYSALASLNIPIDPLEAQLVGQTATQAVAGSFARKNTIGFGTTLMQQPGKDKTNVMEIDLNVSSGYMEGRDLKDTLGSYDATGELPVGQFEQIFQAKLNDERKTAGLIMNDQILHGGGPDAQALQQSSEAVLYNAIGNTMRRAIETGDLTRFGQEQVGYVLDTLTHPNYINKATPELREEIAKQLPQYSNKVFENVYFNDAARTIAESLSQTEFDIPPVVLDVNPQGNLVWKKNPGFSTTTEKAQVETIIARGNPFSTRTVEQTQERLSKEIDEVVVKLNSDKIGNQLIATNAALSQVDKKELASAIAARSQHGVLGNDRKMFTVAPEVASLFEEGAKEAGPPEAPTVGEITQRFDVNTLEEVMEILTTNPNASAQDIADFLNTRNDNGN